MNKKSNKPRRQQIGRRTLPKTAYEEDFINELRQQTNAPISPAQRVRAREIALGEQNEIVHQEG